MTDKTYEFDVDSFLAGGEKCSLFDEINQEIKEEMSDEIVQKFRKREADWNILAYQVVGQEKY